MIKKIFKDQHHHVFKYLDKNKSETKEFKINLEASLDEMESKFKEYLKNCGYGVNTEENLKGKEKNFYES